MGFDSGSVTFCILYKTHLDSFHRILAMEIFLPFSVVSSQASALLNVEHGLLG